MSIIFPICDKSKRPLFVFHRKGELPPPKELADHIADSVMYVNNNKLALGEKWIRTVALIGIDSLISIYNDEGIHMANAFDIKKTYTCELSVKLKCLGLTTDKLSTFTYHIIINGGLNKLNATELTFTSGTNADGTPASQAQLEAMSARTNAIRMAVYATTDFWGDYTLAIKQ